MAPVSPRSKWRQQGQCGDSGRINELRRGPVSVHHHERCRVRFPGLVEGGVTYERSSSARFRVRVRRPPLRPAHRLTPFAYALSHRWAHPDQETTTVPSSSDSESFVRMRPPGGKNRRGRVVAGERKLDQMYPEYAQRTERRTKGEPGTAERQTGPDHG